MSEPQWLSEEEQKAWRKFAAVFTLLPASLDAQLQHDAQLTHFAYFALAMLSEAPDRALRMSELAARSSSSPSRLSHTISRLENRGYVQRARAAEDGRGQVAQMTDDGMNAISEFAPGHVGAVRRFVFDALTAEQVQQLNEISSAILAKIDPDGTLVPPPPGGE
ncbi:MarR family transcriptional regulator [Kineosporia mesophila]|uniref:MarR family transcriptional regulator n=1 Tax=Kineosporia mesophila TaxID=566012 RepID=A0ABP7AUB1_9ACTN|nr:MarR family transcriptional regulator [Kineosporia mesophila]